MQNSIININGLLMSPENAKVSVFDRGFLYGDSIYEVLRTDQGEFFALEEHLERLAQSAELCRMPLHQKPTEIASELQKTKAEFYRRFPDSRSELYCRIVITRGVGKMGFGRSLVQTPTQYVIYVFPLSEIGNPDFERGLNLKISSRIRNHPQALDPAMKSGNYLNSLLACIEAGDEGFDDAILCTLAGEVTEGTTFNIFYVKNGSIITPPLSIGILEGITRRHTIRIIRHLGLSFSEEIFHRDRLFEADEVFATSTLKEVFPVTSIDHRAIGTGKPGPLTRSLAQAFKEKMKGPARS